MKPGTEAIDRSRLDEGQLVAFARQGDREAFREIMTRCNQRLFRIARSVLRDSDEAEDALQEAYTRAFSNLATFRGDSSLLTWLTSITLNEARGRLRRRRRMVAIDAIEGMQAKGAEILMFPSLVEAGDPEREMTRSQLRSLLEHAIDDLPEPFRLVFVLRDIDECSIEETALALGIKPETVRTRHFRARKLLRRALDKKLAAAVTELFPFLGARCTRTTEAVLQQLAPRFGWSTTVSA
ncbi:MAG: RNA polymerase sigma factor [Alphaproteobacteria bacterium]|nr:RNA polymerase sigma factor [Alphaproteobacteria bacterium]